ncbi:MAG: sensor histidine kinase [Rubrobacter sp.]|nr:sensor histidine kinase [Rubrobacter sp.]
MKKRSKEATEALEGNPIGESPEQRPAVRGGLTLPRGGRLIGPLLGLLFLAYPLNALLGSDPSPARLVVALCGTVLFVGVFLWLLWSREPFRAVDPEAYEVRKRRAAVVFLAAVASMLTISFGEEWLTLFVHTGIATGLMLPGKDAPVSVAGLAILAVVAGRAAGAELPAIGRFALPTALLGFLFAALAHHISTIAQLSEAREEIARLAVAEERLRFARDLHDLLGHSLSLIALKSTLAGRLLPATPETEGAAKEVRDVEGVAREALREVREAVAGYRRPTLDGELAGAREMLEAAGIGCHVENEAGALPGSAEAVLAWAVREGATNVIRHSRAERCEIRVANDGGGVRAEVSDDGRGASLEGTTGSGLLGLAERVAASRGGFEAGALPTGGFRLRVSLPLPNGTSPTAEPEPRTNNSSFAGEDGSR